jgi:hypothetical protein
MRIRNAWSNEATYNVSAWLRQDISRDKKANALLAIESSETKAARLLEAAFGLDAPETNGVNWLEIAQSRYSSTNGTR